MKFCSVRIQRREREILRDHAFQGIYIAKEVRKKWKIEAGNDTRCTNSAGQKKEGEGKYKEVQEKKNGEGKTEKIKENEETAWKRTRRIKRNIMW
jgi:hypothetical protein